MTLNVARGRSEPKYSELSEVLGTLQGVLARLTFALVRVSPRMCQTSL